MCRERVVPKLQQHGLRETVPKLPDHVARRREKWKQNGVCRGLDTVIHAASMYTVHSSIAKGLEPGPLSGKAGLIGVFGFRPSGMHGATRSVSYASYSHIGGPFYATSRFELLADMDRAGGLTEAVPHSASIHLTRSDGCDEGLGRVGYSAISNRLEVSNRN